MNKQELIIEGKKYFIDGTLNTEELSKNNTDILSKIDNEFGDIFSFISELKKSFKKDQLMLSAQDYIEDGVIDIALFRVERKNEYNLIHHYFDSIDNFCDELNVVKKQTRSGKNSGPIFLNQLALDHIRQLRSNGKTLEEIGKMYGVSRSCVNQLQQALQKKCTKYPV